MDIPWSGSVVVAAPRDRVYAYLADFPRHAEWAQTLERLELIHPGDASGVGARYRTVERQALQRDRRPLAPLTRGMRVVTICEVRELTPNRKIAWHAHSSPRVLGLYADLSFELHDQDGGTRVTQHNHFHQPDLVARLFRLRFGDDVVQQGRAQWQAGLENIKLVIEERIAPAGSTSLAVQGGAYVA